MKKLSLLLAVVVGIAACRTVPFTGRRQLSLIPVDQETSLGESTYRDTISKAKLSTDADKVAMVRRVGERIAAAAEKPDFNWEFNLIEDDKQVNAFCLPGGKVAVYTGILPVTQDETGLAVVMGHEVAHALAHHGGERMSQGLLASAGGMALAVAMREKPGTTQALAMQAYGVGVGVGVLLPYSRNHESEADRIGLILMAKAGYDPRQAADFWGRMAAKSGEKGDPGLARFLSTHPASAERQENLRKLVPEAMKYYKPRP